MNPVPTDLVAAGVANHKSMFAAESLSTGGVAEEHFDGIFTHGDRQDALVGFPRVPPESEGAFADEVLATVQTHQDVPQVGWWLFEESHTASLGPKLLARGFSWGWRPNWMALDVNKLNENHRSDVEIVPSPRGFAAVRQGREIGTVTCHVDPANVGGIYAMEVDEEHRRQGVGTALTVAATQALREHGCRHVVLNATSIGEPVYKRAGFDRLGELGQTWWMPGERIRAAPPTVAEVKFTEAIGSGDISAAEGTMPGSLDTPLACEETPLAVAVITKQVAAARWLIEHGATLDVVSGWRLGWRDEVRTALERQPELANRRAGPMQLTPLHQAVADNDVGLARAVLAAQPDLGIVEPSFDATALGWAEHLDRPEIEQLIRREHSA